MSADPDGGRPGPPGKVRRWLVLVLLVAYATFLFAAIGLAPVRDLERAGGGASTGWDKVLHFVAFSGLGLLSALAARAFLGARRRGPALAVLGAAAYACVHEGSQAWLPGFAFSLTDLVADLVGVVVGVAVGILATGAPPRGPTVTGPGAGPR